MSIESDLTRIEGAKADIAASIAGKGVEVPEGTKIDGMADLIDQIEQGGGGSAFPEPNYLKENNVGLRLRYYSHIEVPVSVNGKSGCDPVVTNEAKAASFVSSHSMGMPGEQPEPVQITYSTSEGGWGVDQWGMVELIGDGSEAAVLSQVGITVEHPSGAAWFKLLNGNPKVYADQVGNTYYAEYEIQQIGMYPNVTSFRAKDSTGTYTNIPTSAVYAIELANISDTYAFYNQPSLFRNCSNAVSVSAIPEVLSHICTPNGDSDSGFGIHDMPKLNCELYIPVVGDDEFGRFGTNDAPIVCNLPEFNSNIYLPKFVGSSTYSNALSFTGIPKMTSTVYWGKDVAYINPDAFSTTNNKDPIYTKGVNFAGPGAAAAKALLPDLDGTGGKYRKIILAE